MSEIQPGSMIGRYQVVETLGQGGMATVFRAIDTRLEREVAIKLIRTEMFPPAILKEVLARFEREAKALARLDHPNILRVFDFGEYEGIPYLVMAFVGGGTLRERLRSPRGSGRKMPFRDAAALLAPVARALHYAHAHHIVHRDVKPANILLNDRDEPQLSDFGIAKILDAGGAGLTGTGLAIGTPEYMAPEQSAGDEVDSRVDIYALGVVFFEMITGRRPFEGSTPIDVLIKIRTAPMPDVRQYLPDVPPEVETILSRALARETAARYATMGLFADDLELLARSPAQMAFTPAPIPAPTAVQPKPPTPPPFAPVQAKNERATPPPFSPAPAPAEPLRRGIENLDSGRTMQTPPSWPPQKGQQTLPLADSGRTMQTPQPAYPSGAVPAAGPISRPRTLPYTADPYPSAPAQAANVAGTPALSIWVLFAVAAGVLVLLMLLLFPGSGLVPPAPTPTFMPL